MKQIPHGTIGEVFGEVSCGKTLLLHSLLREASIDSEFFAIIDALGSFDPHSAARAGVDLKRLLWIRANGRIENALKATDMILHAGGFGVVVLDLCEVSVSELNRIPLSYWYRFRLAVENTPTSLIVTGDRPLVKSCARVQLEVKRERLLWRGPVFEGIDYQVAPRKALRMAG
jgi:hypothetical protein